MALTLAACGDSENDEEGEGIVQEVNQEVSQEDEDGTVEVAKNEEVTDTVDPSGNDVRVAHASSSGNSGNGFAVPVVKPGEEPNPGEEPQPGAGTQQPQPSAGSQQQPQPSAGSQQQPQPSAGSQQQPQPSTGSQQQPQPSTAPQQQPQPSTAPQQQPQPSTAPQQQPKPSAGSQQQPQPSAGSQQPQQTQQTQQPQPGTASQQPSTGTQTAHTHNFQGGNCSTPATCSCGATGSYGSHNWETKTKHHDATGHFESKVTGTETVEVQKTVRISYCRDCGYEAGDWDHSDSMQEKWVAHVKETGHNLSPATKLVTQSTYETRNIVEDVWVQDTAAWDEKVTTCSICGAKQ